MIEVTRLDNSKVLINAELIQSLQATPDTVITFTTRERMMVKECVEEVSKKIVDYHRSIRAAAAYLDSEHISSDTLRKVSGM